MIAVLSDQAEAQRERILGSYHDVRVIAVRYKLSHDEQVHAYDIERAFNAAADIGEFNRRHPEEPIT